MPDIKQLISFFYLQQSALTPEPVAMTTVGFCGNSGKYFNQQGLSHFLSRTVLPLLNLLVCRGVGYRATKTR